MFGMLTSWIDQASETVKDLTDQGADIVRQTGLLDLIDSPRGAAPVAGEDLAAPAPQVVLNTVTDPPSAWAASTDEWRFLIYAALANKHFCSSPPSHTVDDADTWGEVKRLLALDETAAAPFVAGARTLVAEPAEDLAEWLPTVMAIYVAYAALVPRTVTDEVYWGIIEWKLTLCRRCTQPDQLLGVLKALSRGRGSAGEAELAAAPMDTSAQAARDDALRSDEGCWSATERDLRTLQGTLQWRASLETDVRKEIELASGNLKLLRSLLAKQDACSDLAQSVAESCSYHKVKLAKLMGTVDEEQERLVNSPLDGNGLGALYTSLMDINAGIQEAMAAFEGRKHSAGTSSPEAPSLPPHCGREGSVRARTLDGAGANHVKEQEGSSSERAPAVAATPPTLGDTASTSSWVAAEPSAAASGDDGEFGDTSFEARMPWEDDDI